MILIECLNIFNCLEFYSVNTFIHLYPALMSFLKFLPLLRFLTFT